MTSQARMSRRAALHLAAAAGGALVVAACGATPTPTPPPKPAATPTPPRVAAPTATPVPAKAVEIQFRAQIGAVPNGAEIWRRAVTNVMEKKPHLKVVMTGATYSDADEQQLITAMAAGTGPDVWCHGGSSGGFWGAKGVAAPLDDLLKMSPMAGDYFEAETMPHSWGGKLYAIAWRLSPPIMQWRKDIFREVGLDPNSTPKSWQDLAEMGKKLATWKGDDIQRIGFGIPFNAAHFYFGLFLHSAGGGWFSPDFKTTRINEPPGVEALQFCVDLFHKYKVNATYTVQPTTAGVPLLVTGQMAMDWVNLAPYFYAKANKPELLANWGVGMPPPGPKAHGSIIFVDTLLLNAASKVKEAGWELITEFSTYEQLEYLTSNQGALVPRKSWYEKFPEKVKADPMIAAGLEGVRIAFPIHWGPQWTPYRIALIPFITEAILQKRTPKDALDAAAAKLNNEILKS